MAARVLGNPEEDGWNVLLTELTLDDTIFMGSIQAYQHNQHNRQAMGMPKNDKILYHLINIGSQDMNADEKPWDVSTRAIRFATCTADHLWVMLTHEQERVCVYLLPFLIRRLILMVEQSVGGKDLCFGEDRS